MNRRSMRKGVSTWTGSLRTGFSNLGHGLRVILVGLRICFARLIIQFREMFTTKP